MRARVASGIAWSMWGASWVGAAGFVATTYASGGVTEDLSDGIPLVLAFAAFATVGAIVASRRPENAIGWIFSAIGLLAGVGMFATQYADYSVSGSSPPAWGILAAWVATWFWFPLLTLFTVFTLLLFPTGRLPSPRWRPLLWLAITSATVVTLAAALQDNLDAGRHPVSNPVGITGFDGPEQGALGGALLFLLFVCTMGAAASLVVRYKRARSIERQQLKWFTYAGVLVPVLLFAGDNLHLPGVGTLLDLTVATLPIAAGIAILRYRLYDIDRIINRTLVYGALTAFLGAIYFGAVVLLQALLGEAVGRSPLAVAGTTLTVAALFRPARARIQATIDRRFNRRRYDAQQTADAFSARLRDEVDLNSLSADLLGVVRETMQPAHASLWLRGSEGQE